jgi:hypothetical protein
LSTTPVAARCQRHGNGSVDVAAGTRDEDDAACEIAASGHGAAGLELAARSEARAAFRGTRNVRANAHLVVDNGVPAATPHTA